MPWHAANAHAGFSTVKPLLPVSDVHSSLAVDQQEHDPESTLALARRLLSLRRSSVALRRGALHMLAADAGWLVFERSVDRQRLLCVFNISADEASWQPDSHAAWRIVARVGGGTQWLLPRLSGLIAELR